MTKIRLIIRISIIFLVIEQTLFYANAQHLSKSDIKSQIRILKREGILEEYDRAKAKSNSPEELLYNFREEMNASMSRNESSESFGPKLNDPSVIGKIKPIEIEKLESYQKNFLRVIQNPKPSGVRVWKGDEVKDIGYLDAALLQKGKKQTGICSGVLISPNYIITAAHCYCQNPNFIKAVFGNRPYPYYDDSPIRQSMTHIDCKDLESRENFIKNINKGDLALFKLEKPVPKVTPVKIATDAMIHEKIRRKEGSVRAVGFGLAGSSGGVKHYGDITIASEDCRNTPQGPWNCAANQELMAVDPAGKIDTCEGDSGGPIYIRQGKKFLLVGITSRAIKYGGKCGEGGIYVKLTTIGVKQWLIDNGVPTTAFLKNPGRVSSSTMRRSKK